MRPESWTLELARRIVETRGDGRELLKTLFAYDGPESLAIDATKFGDLDCCSEIESALLDLATMLVASVEVVRSNARATSTSPWPDGWEEVNAVAGQDRVRRIRVFDGWLYQVWQTKRLDWSTPVFVADCTPREVAHGPG